jgi:hypothetical protein
LSLDEADVAAADLIDALAQHCAIDAKVGEVESEDDIEEAEEAVGKNEVELRVYCHILHAELVSNR